MHSPLCTVSPFQGLHFILSDHVPVFDTAGESNCSLHILHRFPPDVFVDPYELEQRVLDNVGPSFKVWGETDLELPVSAVSEGSLVLLGPVTAGARVDLPIHARYPLPSWTSSHTSVALEDSTLMIVCDRHHYTRKKQRLDDLFGPYGSPFDLGTVEIALQPFRSSPPLSIRVPTGNQAHLSYIEPLTVVAVFFCVLYMAHIMWKASRRFTNNSKVKTD